MRKLPFVRLMEVGTDLASEVISWIINNSKLRGADDVPILLEPEIEDTLNTPIYQVQKNIEAVYDLTALSGLRANAPTENRFTYFATDLNIPIWYNSTTKEWVNIDGISQPLEVTSLMLMSSDGMAIQSSDGKIIASTE
jgi:hypothetical protein